MRHYKKSLPKTPVVLSNGVRIKFSEFPDGFGYLKTDNERLITDLDACVQRKIGGITSISEAEYEAELKKNESISPPQKQSYRQSPPALVNLDRDQLFMGRRAGKSEIAAARESESNKPVPIPVKPGMPLAAMRGKWIPKAVKL